MENEIINYSKTYEEYKAELDGVLRQTAEGFVKIGYLLKVARDTNVLANSGYKTVTEFAEAEYNLNKTQVSRFISINDRFSEGGYSDHLQTSYQGYGYAKLTIMLQLPDAINESLSPSYSKAEIQAVKDEVDEEKKVSDIERFLETPTKAEGTKLDKAIYQLGQDDPNLFKAICLLLNKDYTLHDLKEEMAPAEEKTYSIRIPGIGRIMLMLTMQECRTVDVRSGAKDIVSWEEVEQAWCDLIGADADYADRYKELYTMSFPEEKKEIAPVQQKKEPRKESKVQKADKIKFEEQSQMNDIYPEVPKVEPNEPKEEPIEPKTEEIDSNEQIPGQETIEDDFKEVLPNVTETAEVVEDPSDKSNVIRGYKAAVTNTMNRMQKAIEYGQWSDVEDLAKGIQWRAAEIVKLL